MSLCLLADSLGVARAVQQAALETWARPGGVVTAAWLVRDSGIMSTTEHPGFVVADKQTLWVHQPLASEIPDDGAARLARRQHLESSWVPPPDLTQNQTEVIDAVVWQVSRRWRVLASPTVLQHFRKDVQESCEWLGYFPADSYVDTTAVMSVIEHELEVMALKRKESLEQVRKKVVILGRGMNAETQGTTMPLLYWGGDFVHGIWASSGILLNAAAVKQLAVCSSAGSTDGSATGELSDYFVRTVTHWIVNQGQHLTEAMAGQRQGDGQLQGLAELAFATSLRSQHRSLLIDWVTKWNQRFFVKELLLERFAFRLGSATFGWSALDRKQAGLPGGRLLSGRRWQPRKRRQLRRRLLQGGVRFTASCLGLEHHGSWCGAGVAMLPQCVVSFYPVDSPALLRGLHKAVSNSSCMAGSNLRLPQGVRIVRPLKHSMRVYARREQLFERKASQVSAPSPLRRADASRSSSWCRAVAGNRKLWARLTSIVSLSASPARRHWAPRLKLDGRGEEERHWSCPSWHLSPRARRETGGVKVPKFLHPDEWIRGPGGELHLSTPLTLLVSLPNSGTTWILSVIQMAHQARYGCTAVNSDIMHPHCNSGLSVELSKVMGAPEDDSWPNLFSQAPPVALELLVQLMKDQQHGWAYTDLHYMRKHGMTYSGEVVPPELRWPWRGVVPRSWDITSIGLIMSKEILNFYKVSQHLRQRHDAGRKSEFVVIALYRHRAHCFPMSNNSHTLCKHCMYEKMLRSFEVSSFEEDPAMAGMQRWWRRHSKAVGGRESPSGLVFAHLISWYPMLRSQRYGLHALDYAKLLVLSKEELREYLNSTLPRSLQRQPGVAPIASSFHSHRFGKSSSFLQKRTSLYMELGAEPFARHAIQEMQRLDAMADLSLLRR